MLKDKLKRVKLKDLNPAPYNPNYMEPNERRLLKQSLKEYDYIQNIVVNDRPWTKERDLTIIDGHHRVEEMLEDGVEEEDVVIVHLDGDREKALNLALRRIKGKADPELELKVVEELSVKGFDVELAGFDDIQLQELTGGLNFGEIPDLEDMEQLPRGKPKLITCPHCGEEFDINS